ncbi:twin-arginine translocation signal domain-containing protein [Mesorhizobium sp.]|uniref:twin-arginine translocation signal domain-containing protein n=1 Tax=Mesorhizobium sp. TaxID=1871066 RepID=UPI00257C3902|nr:twin-arginine translocation signal domain-containing protein [Mesorhizobium sp.]
MERRQFLTLAGAGLGSMLIAPRIVFANVETDRRFVFIIQRGAADGLDTIVPYADPPTAHCAPHWPSTIR